MRTWNLTADDPLALRLAADVRLGPTDYADDQIWELTLAGGDPPALALRTAYGLRCRDARLFASFRDVGTAPAAAPPFVTDPKDFAAPVTLTKFYVSYLEVRYSPLPAIQVVAEYWAADSHAVAGRLTIANEGSMPRTVAVHLSSVLRPSEGGEVMGPVKIGDTNLLTGKTGNLVPALVAEGPGPADVTPWPSLSRTLELAPGETGYCHWVQAARASAEESLAAARAVFARRPWEAEFSKIELVNASNPEIETGDRDWDAAFAFAHKVSLACYVGPTSHLTHPSFIFTRIPERGYSRAGDGSDHPWQWDGQVATEAYVNLPIITPAAPELAKGVIRNWLAVQAPDGFIDWKPGLAGQRNRALCIPLLASIAWQIYEHTEDRDFLAEVYPGLRQFFEHWFRPKYDRDQDGVPEWTHTIQSAFDSNPSFDRFSRWAQAADITQAESPDLAAYLYREAQSLIAISQLLNIPDDVPGLSRRAETLRAAVAKMWNDATGSYHYVDRDHHESPTGGVLAQGRGEVSAEINRRFAPSARVLIRSYGPGEARPPVSVAIHGRGRRGRRRIETIKPSHFQWYWGMGTASSEKLYAEIERVEVNGLTDEFETTVSTTDYTRQDQTLLLPLWAGLPDRGRAEALRKTILDPERYWRPYGIPNCSAQDPAYRPDNRDGSGGVWMMWNTMLGEGLVEYGYRDEAAELIRHVMAAMLHTLKNEKTFREAYNSDALEGLGDRDYLWGVAPAYLFLKTVGIRIISSRKVWLTGRNPFPNTVTIRYRGVSVSKSGSTSVVVFPSEREVVVTSVAEQMVEDNM
ncbi:MAG: hypothetical protein HY260_20325 [Chloroflexi bacterium]|nr:hypothetical protein [Chloroflexota bacterium]